MPKTIEELEATIAAQQAHIAKLRLGLLDARSWMDRAPVEYREKADVLIATPLPTLPPSWSVSAAIAWIRRNTEKEK